MAKRRGKQPDTPCADCGKLLYTSPHSLPAAQRRCRDCRRLASAQRPAVSCETCCASFTPSNNRQRFCSRTCFARRAGQVVDRAGRTCEVCGATYRANHADQRACSRSCGVTLRRTVTRSFPTAPPSKGPLHGPPVPKKEKPAPSVRVFFPYCSVCNASFATPYTVSTCSDTCAEEKKRKDRRLAKDRRRALMRDAFVSNVYRQKIYERDRWRCQLCDKPVRRNAVTPHPLAPTLDHIVPLAAGGTHEPSNCQLAHYICNSRKGASAVHAEQLRLIG